jgi:hypothetical protein
MKTMELYSMIGYSSPYNIQLPIVKNIKTKDQKYWKAGTGYGNYDNSEWNINKFIDGNMLKNEKIYNILSNIVKNIDDHINPLLCEIVEKQFETINLMIFNEQHKIYTLYLDILNKIIKTSKINISNSIRHMVRDINNIIMNETLVKNIKDDIDTWKKEIAVAATQGPAGYPIIADRSKKIKEAQQKLASLQTRK